LNYTRIPNYVFNRNRSTFENFFPACALFLWHKKNPDSRLVQNRLDLSIVFCLPSYSTLVR